MLSTAAVMTTYNGEKYLIEQLDSLRLQTRPLDRVLIFDDCSADGTYGLLQDYVARHGLTAWKICRNQANVGWRQNFYQALSAVDADLVFPCDQDDIWDVHKVEEMAAIMEKDSSLDMLACHVATFYLGGSRSYREDEYCLQDEPLRVKPGEKNSIYIYRPGCSYCIRGAYLRAALDHWDPSYSYDDALWRYAAFKGTLAAYGRKLVNYRRHDGNISERNSLNRANRLDDIGSHITAMKKTRDFCQDLGCLTDEKETVFQDVIPWFEARYQLVSGKNRIRNLRRVIRGRAYYRTKNSWKVDVALSLFGRLEIPL